MLLQLVNLTPHTITLVDVSIPQAVGVVATIDEDRRSLIAEYAVFQYRKR